MNALEWLVSNPVGTFLLLALAAFLEAFGDSFFQIGLHRSAAAGSGAVAWGGRIFAFAAGTAVLAAYGTLLNAPRWDFGRLVGMYVALFFVMGQIMNRVRFGQTPTLPVCAGGALIVAGGLLIAFWKG